MNSVTKGQDGSGIGLVLTLDEPLDLESITCKIKSHMGLEYVRRAYANQKKIKTIWLYLLYISIYFIFYLIKYKKKEVVRVGCLGV